MRDKVFLICFIGIDGSGKTTLSKELVKLFNKKGVKCKYVYARLNSLISKPLILLGHWLFLRNRNMFKNYVEYSATKKKLIKKHSLLSSIYQKILLFDYLLQMLFKVKLPMTLGKSSIVCDRYLFDTVITDLSVDMNYSKDETMRLIDKLLFFIPKPDVTFLIDISEEIAYHRKDDVPSIEYLKERRKRYLDIAKQYDMVILDGSRQLEELICDIEKEVFQ